jgi:hypothetical protein
VCLFLGLRLCSRCLRWPLPRRHAPHAHRAAGRSACARGCLACALRDTPHEQGRCRAGARALADAAPLHAQRRSKRLRYARAALVLDQVWASQASRICGAWQESSSGRCRPWILLRAFGYVHYGNGGTARADCSMLPWCLSGARARAGWRRSTGPVGDCVGAAGAHRCARRLPLCTAYRAWSCCAVDVQEEPTPGPCLSGQSGLHAKIRSRARSRLHGRPTALCGAPSTAVLRGASAAQVRRDAACAGAVLLRWGGQHDLPLFGARVAARVR